MVYSIYEIANGKQTLRYQHTDKETAKRFAVAFAEKHQTNTCIYINGAKERGKGCAYFTHRISAKWYTDKQREIYGAKDHYQLYKA